MSQTQQPAPQASAPLVLNVQYIKDLSFEVPGAPQIFATLRQPPAVQINLDVQVRRIEDNASVFEVTLAIRAAATTTSGQDGQSDNKPPQTVFLAELQYAGVFTTSGIPDNQLEPVLAIECPRLLFPFARNILADVTRDGGFSPVFLGPIDFVGLWQARRAATAQRQAAPVANT